MSGRTPLLTERDKADEVIGERIHVLMWRQARTQDELADVLGVPRTSVSNRLRGKIKWKAVEVAITAAWLGVEVGDLIPAVAAHPVLPGPNGFPQGAVLMIGRHGRHSK